MNDYIEFSPNPKQAKATLKIFFEYWNQHGLKGNLLKVIKRETHINDYVGSNFTFIEYLKKKLKNPGSRNNIISGLEKFFDYLILCESSKSGKKYENPVIFKYDKFKIETKHATYRKPIPENVILYMQELLLSNNFEFTRKYFKEDVKDRYNHISQELDKYVLSLNVTFIIYLMLVLPLRAKHIINLDSGEFDEFLYRDRMMVPNRNGVKGRKEGFIQMGYYNGVSKKVQELLYVNTNKGNACGFEIPWISQDILELVRLQMSWLRAYDLLDRSCNLFSRLFRENGKEVSKAKVYRFWNVLCQYAQEELGIELVKDGKCVYDLHSLRVSGVSHALGKGMNLGDLSNNLAGHHSKHMTLHYNGIGDLDTYIKQAENGRKVKFLEELNEV